MSVIHSEMYYLAIIGLVTSVISAFYYLRIIKIIYFDKPAKSFDENNNLSIKVPIVISALALLIYFVYPSSLIDIVEFIKII